MGESKRRFKIIDTHIGEVPCLNCGKILDFATGIRGSKPKPGSISICFDCGHIQIFDANMKFRELNDEEVIEIAGSKEILMFQKAREKVKERANGCKPGTRSI
jgi:hypothetical protein